MTTHYLTWLLAIPAVSARGASAALEAGTRTIKRFSIGAMLVEFIVSLRLICADYQKPDTISSST